MNLGYVWYFLCWGEVRGEGRCKGRCKGFDAETHQLCL